MAKRPIKRPASSSRFNPLGLRSVRSASLPKPGLNRQETSRKGKRVVGERFFSWLPWPRRGSFHFTWKKFFIGMGIFVALFLVAIAGTFAYFVRDLPNPKELSARPIAQSTKILDRNGKEIYNFFGEENRTLLNSDQISDYSKKASVAVEDANFYHHEGFSLKGIGRAVVCRVYPGCNRASGGGSTITQQYIKNSLIDDEYKLTRKLRELILSIEVEQVYTKDEILTGYLNEIPFGGSIYGLEVASQTYFNKPAKDVTLSEAAILAAIPQRPGRYSPYGNNLELLFARKDYVLDRMVKVGYITQEEADAAKKDAPNLENPNFAQRKDLVAPHFVFYVREELVKFIEEQKAADPQQAEIALDRAGYVVTTSLELEAQQLAEAVMQEMGPTTVKKYQASNAAMVATNPQNGEILAMVGSVNYSDSKSGNTNFANSLLQPGSSFKPFVYATAFDKEHKKSPASTTFDLQTDFGNYIPQNYDGRFRGPVTNRNALAQSLNIPAVKNLAIVGIPNAIGTAERLGITTLTSQKDRFGLSLVLGAGEVKPVEMANAYASFANGGKHYALRPILKIEKDGKLIKDFTQQEPTQALEPEIAWQMSNILSDNAARTPVFGARNNLILGDRPVGAKSGTTNSNRDAWTVGFTPQISTAVWVGNNEANKTMVKGADGSIVAAPIWKRFMQEYLKGKPVQEFTRPESLKQVTIDFLSGKLPTDQSPSNERITDWLADWQIPTEFDDVHTKVKIDRVSGKLATDLTPAENIEERIYFFIRSEFPDKPNWEAPVQAWAREHGGGIAPPTDKDDVHTEDNRPTISITSPKSGATVSETFTITSNPGGSKAIRQVEFFIDNVSIGAATGAPWSITYNAESLVTGSHVIDAVVTNEIGLTRSTQITVNKGGDTTPPGPVSGLSAVKGSLPLSVKLSWTNPGDADLSRVAIYYSTNSGTLGSRYSQTPAATPGSAGSVEISGLPPGPMFFTVRPIDQAGNENQSTNQVSYTVK